MEASMPSSLSLNSNDDEDTIINDKSEVYLFFDGIESLENSTIFFSNVTKLVIIGQPIQRITGLQEAALLKELWMVECSLQKIENLENCLNLEKLYLYSNNISQIEGLDNLKKLHVLWLSGNRITTIKNIHHLQELKELYLCENCIKKTDQSLLHNKNLKILNLSGNPLCDLNEINNFTIVESLMFSDPGFESCPITWLCNYRFLVIYQLENLKALDTFEVEEEERMKTRDFLGKKIIYYNMLQNKLKSKYFRNLLNIEKDSFLAMKRYKDNLFCLKVEELQININKQSLSQEANSLSNITSKQDFIGFHIKNWLFLETQKKTVTGYKYKVHASQMDVEQQHGGNIKFHHYSIEHSGINSFQKLIDCFSCTDILGDLGISSVKVYDVTEVTNRSFECMYNYLKKRKSFNKISWQYYLLSGIHGAKRMDDWPIPIIKFGLIKEKCVNVTNCIAIADYCWMLNIKKRRDSSFGYHGVNVKERRCVTVIRTSDENLSLANQEEAYLCHKREKSCSKSCSEFRVKALELVYPVLVIEYEYIFQDSFAIKKQEHYGSHELHSSQRNLKQEVTRMNILNDYTLRTEISEYLWNKMTKLSFQACNIKTIENLPCLPNINTVDLSYNKLASFGGLCSFPNVRDLDLSFNNICTLADMNILKSLDCLDISWNSIGNSMSVLKTLRRCSPNITKLEMSFNPIEDVTNINHMLCFLRDYLPKIYQHNGKMVEFSGEIVHSLSQMGSIINEDLIDLSCPKVHLTTQWKCEQLYQSLACTSCLNLKCNNDVICIIWKNRGIQSIQSIKEMERLKWANLDDNYIRSIDFLKRSVFLEELSISHNVLQVIDEALLKLNKLVKLDLSNNYISSISSLSKSYFPLLKHFNISKNHLSNLLGMEACPALVEFYAHHNLIETTADLHSIKSCINLMILDLSANKIEIVKNFRTFIIFHLPLIEVINGQPLTESEVKEANTIFGGCLDLGYLIRQNKLSETDIITELTLNNCSFKKIDLKASSLPNLASLDLRSNNLISLWGLHDLPKLQSLCLSYNNVQMLSTDEEITEWLTSRKKVMYSTSMEQLNTNNECPLFPKLQILYLNNNGLQSLVPLCLEKMKHLHTLFLQGNEISDIKGLGDLTQLQHLILDGNKISFIEHTEISRISKLENLYLENNRIMDLSFIKSLSNLRRLFLSQNKINDSEQLQHLTFIDHLEEITLIGNPLFCNATNYCCLLHYSPSITRVDGLFIKQRCFNIEDNGNVS